MALGRRNLSRPRACSCVLENPTCLSLVRQAVRPPARLDPSVLVSISPCVEPCYFKILKTLIFIVISTVFAIDRQGVVKHRNLEPKTGRPRNLIPTMPDPRVVNGSVVIENTILAI